MDCVIGISNDTLNCSSSMTISHIGMIEYIIPVGICKIESNCTKFICVILKPPNTIIRPANAIVTHSIIILTILLAFLGSLSFTTAILMCSLCPNIYVADMIINHTNEYLVSISVTLLGAEKMYLATT